VETFAVEGWVVCSWGTGALVLPLDRTRECRLFLVEPPLEENKFRVSVEILRSRRHLLCGATWFGGPSILRLSAPAGEKK
jgi:hypothetical protein